MYSILPITEAGLTSPDVLMTVYLVLGGIALLLVVLLIVVIKSSGTVIKLLQESGKMDYSQEILRRLEDQRESLRDLQKGVEDQEEVVPAILDRLEFLPDSEGGDNGLKLLMESQKALEIEVRGHLLQRKEFQESLTEMLSSRGEFESKVQKHLLSLGEVEKDILAQVEKGTSSPGSGSAALDPKIGEKVDEWSTTLRAEMEKREAFQEQVLGALANRSETTGGGKSSSSEFETDVLQSLKLLEDHREDVISRLDDTERATVSLGSDMKSRFAAGGAVANDLLPELTANHNGGRDEGELLQRFDLLEGMIQNLGPVAKSSDDTMPSDEAEAIEKLLEHLQMQKKASEQVLQQLKVQEQAIADVAIDQDEIDAREAFEEDVLEGLGTLRARLESLETLANDVQEVPVPVGLEGVLGERLTELEQKVNRSTVFDLDELESSVESLIDWNEKIKEDPEFGIVKSFSAGIIKHIDLVETLLLRYEKQKNKDLVKQVGVLREGLEDVLRINGIVRYEYSEGTEVDLALRRKIRVVEKENEESEESDEDLAHIRKTYRPGYILNHPEAGEIILRKTEVKTS